MPLRCTENTVVTNENGEAFLEHLAPGIYEVTEKINPLRNNEQEVSVFSSTLKNFCLNRFEI